jgi:hypothetical protein
VGHPLGELIPAPAERGCECDPRRKRRWDGDDHSLRPRPNSVRFDAYAASVLGDPAHRRAEHDVIAQLRREPLREQLRAADEAVLLCAALDIEERVEAPGRAHVREHPERGQLGGPRPHHGTRRDLEQAARLLRAGRLADPTRQRLRVEVSRLRRVPRCVGRDPACGAPQPAARATDIEQHVRREARNRAPVAAELAAELEQVAALVIGREGLDLELARQREQPVLARPDPLAAHLDDPARADRGVQRSAAHPVAGLDDEHIAAGGDQLPCRHQTRQTGAHHDDVGVSSSGGGGHARTLSRGASRVGGFAIRSRPQAAGPHNRSGLCPSLRAGRPGGR